ncbi:glycoside hydrolase family 13 protein [uncultured Hymenobacter sp.]|uniref:glycoside hydrolase family 13 protein n=1 Tax=uncultured Hymenobacter sp. TaxID=170016 RepID=UPI0035CB3239
MKLLHLLLAVLLLRSAVSLQAWAAPPHSIEAAKKTGAIARIDPTFWWVGMKNPELQLLVHGPGITESQVALASYPGVSLNGMQRLQSSNYLIVNLTISPSAQPGKLKLTFTGKTKTTYEYELRPRVTGDKSRVQGITSADFIYFLMPDRFANGNPQNDIIKGTRQHTIARDSMYARHGGDLKGIEQHFDYLKSMGVTAIWPTPVVANDMPKASYHGYALTDYYAIDPRYGTTEEYRQFVLHAHQQGLKVVHDVVLNHMGSYNYLFLDQPAPDWFHQWPTFTRSNYNNAPLNDPYASQADTKLYNEGWFDTSMPDINQANPLVANYLIQNFLWWVEYTGLDAYRIDTYPYSDPQFLLKWGQALLDEYPQLGLFGESTVHSPAQEAFFVRNVFQPVNSFKGNLPSALDFPLNGAIGEALNREHADISKLYYALQADWMYQDPTRNVIFLDNHDQNRFYSVIGEDFNKMKMGLAWLFTMRGTPQLYYGTELLMKNFANPDGLVRADFPGGWMQDPRSAFTTAGRTTQENEAFTYVRTLGTYRKTHPVLHTGKLMQFIPQDGIYTYFRYDGQGNTVMVLMNSNKETKGVDLTRFAERLTGYSSALDVLTGATIANLKTAQVPASTALVWELRK